MNKIPTDIYITCSVDSVHEGHSEPLKYPVQVKWLATCSASAVVLPLEII